MMPKLSGLEVLQKLRGTGCQTPILLLTAKTEVEDQIQGLDLGADDYLPKPFPMELLLARVRALLRRRVEYTPTCSVAETTPSIRKAMSFPAAIKPLCCPSWNTN